MMRLVIVHNTAAISDGTVKTNQQNNYVQTFRISLVELICCICAISGRKYFPGRIVCNNCGRKRANV